MNEGDKNEVKRIYSQVEWEMSLVHHKDEEMKLKQKETEEHQIKVNQNQERSL